MKFPKLAALLVPVFILGGTSTASADIESKARAYCNDQNVGRPKSVESCVRAQLRAANEVGMLLKQTSGDQEVKRAYERCARNAEETPGIHNWNKFRWCLVSEIKSYNKFKRAAEAGKGNEFAQGVIAYCRETIQIKGTFTYQALEYCRTRQTKAGYQVGEDFELIDEGSLDQYAMDDCATKYVTTAGNYDWVSIGRCTKRVLRRIGK